MYETKHGIGTLIGRSPEGDLHMSFTTYDGTEYKPCMNTFVKPSDVTGMITRKTK